jgi:hypothetical protein
MGQSLHGVSDQVGLFLQYMGIRPCRAAYIYLHFMLSLLRLGTPFRNSIWELTAIHFGRRRESVLACIRRELHRAYAAAPERFYNGDGAVIPLCPPRCQDFLRFAQAMLAAYTFRSACRDGREQITITKAKVVFHW